jgi:hypothetical protein
MAEQWKSAGVDDDADMPTDVDDVRGRADEADDEFEDDEEDLDDEEEEDEESTPL